MPSGDRNSAPDSRLTQLLSRVEQLGIRLWLDGDRLRYDAPEGALTAALRDELRSHRDAIVEALRGDAAMPPSAPLSFVQERLWFLDQLGAGSAYNMPSALRLRGRLDIAALERSVRAIVARHDVLRAAFPTEDGQPVQRIAPELAPPFELVDLGHRRRDAQTLILEEAMRPFDLAAGPLLRVRLYRLDDDNHVMVSTAHHIIFDGWSWAVFTRELSEFYRAFSTGDAPQVPELAAQYGDFVAWQQDRLQGERRQKLLAFWRRTLDSDLQPLALPTDRPRPAAQTFRGATRRFQIPQALAAALPDLARRARATQAMLLLAAFKVLLARYSGQHDVAVGSPIANRTRADVENLIGPFVNTLVLRSDLSGDPSFLEVLRRVRRVSLDAHDHQELPFECLVEAVGASRDMSQNPLFQVGFTLQNMPRAELVLGELSIAAEPLELTTTRVDLELHMVERPNGLFGGLVYNTDLFDDETADQMARHFVRLLQGAVDAPAARISTLAMMDDGESRRLLVDWNRTASDYSDSGCIHELIEDHAREAPHAIAVVSEAGQFTYEELNARANRVAHTLRARGVGPDVLVGLCAERSLEMVVGILGILKAGGAYLPLDPTHPSQRLAFMLEDSAVPLLLTQERLLDVLPESGVEILCFDRDCPEFDAAPDGDPDRIARPDNLAYAIYTSGSTGNPKGTLLSHRGLCNVSAQQALAFDVGPDSRALQFSSLSFDASTFDVVMALPKGATLVLRAAEGLLPGPDLVSVLRRHRVSIVTLPPSALGAMPAAELPDLRTITVAGEACPPGLVEGWAAGRRFFNLYGPTEATIWSTMARLEIGAPVHIGRPIGNVAIYVLDGDGAPVPIGVPGELHIAGVGLARGYLNRPDLTAERFVPNPFAGGGERLYRTGDLVRHRRDGNLEFVGRIDQQVKVRGYRIEIGEIEAVLSRHSAVRDVAVLCREDQPGEKRLVAYVTGRGHRAVVPSELREFLGVTLPDYMIPTAFVVLDALPLTHAGKVDRRALPAPEREAAVEEAFVAPRSQLEESIAAIWAEVLGVERVGVRDQFLDLGGHSLLLVKLQARLSSELKRAVSIVDLFHYPTVEALAEHLGGAAEERSFAREARERAERRARSGLEPIAVVGIAGRFPGAPDPETLWSNLCDGVESVRFFSDDELREAGIDDSILRHPDFVNARAALDGVDMFDAWHFGYTPREAETMDPQHRLFLECAWESLERAGYDPERYAGLIGVFAGASRNNYAQNLQSHPDRAEEAAGVAGVVSNDKDFLSTRVSYKLNLRGPAMTVQTACSTSLVAVHEACTALLTGQCDIALAGGVSASVPPIGGYLYQEGGIGSPDGHCRTFDANAQGTVRGDGVGIVVLKRLAEAVRDGDDVQAVILATAINNDGSNKVGYTAPSVAGQAEVIAMAQAAAGVEPDTIGYVEAHGTATPLGDPIEVEALTVVFRESTQRAGFCGLGSIKSNMGHLDAAAGVAGFIKAALTVRHGRIPPSLHFEQPNPAIDFAGSPFYVATSCRDWTTGSGVPRRAGVSSFGIGGTNVHAVLEEPPEGEASSTSRPWQLLTISARSDEALDAAAQNLASYLRTQREANLADVAHTLQVGRRELECRQAVVCTTVDDAIAALEGKRPEQCFVRRVAQRARSVVFLFPGHGHQHVNMGLGLYRSEPVFRAAVDECLADLEGELDFDLRSAIFPSSEVDAAGATEVLLSQPVIFQPAVFIISYATARLWQSWGIQPAACLGHSLGEYVAAAISGALRLEDALRLVVLRGQLMAATPPGAMLSISLPEADVRELIADEDEVWLSTINAPELCMVAGPPTAIDAFEAKLARSDVECSRLHATHAYHSGMMESGVGALSDAVAELEVRAPAIPYVSNLTGDWITEAQVRDPEYWGRHMADPVRFADGMSRVLEDSNAVFLEVGPGRMLSSLARKHASCGPESVLVSSLPHPDSEVSDDAFVMEALGRLWTGGVRVDWAQYRDGERRRRVVLPTYPFQRKRYWVEPRRGATTTGRRNDLADWFYTPVWRRSRWVSGSGASDTGVPILVFVDESDFSSRVVEELRRSGRPVVTVEAGEVFAGDDRAYSIDPRSAEDYVRLLRELRDTVGIPRDIIHLWSVSFVVDRPDNAAAEHLQVVGLRSALELSRALGGSETTESIRVHVVTDGVHEVVGGEAICPEKATVLGVCRIAPLELANVTYRNIDLAPEEGLTLSDERVEALIGELLAGGDEPIVALRAGRRWVQSFTPAPLEGVEGANARRLRPRGTYLLTGGLGGMGIEIGMELARSVQARLVLVGRTPLPDRVAWEQHLAEHGGEDVVSRRIRAIEALEAAGAEVMVATADVCDLAQMQRVVLEANERFGRIHGVVHLAGLPGGGLIQQTPSEKIERVTAPKVQGTRVLEQLFGAMELDFVLLASSIITSWGLRGWTDYCAANSYLDAFARRFAADTGTFTVALDWPRWGESGMAVDFARARGERTPVEGVSDAEGLEILRRVLDRCDEAQILVSDVDFRGPMTPRLEASASESEAEDRDRAGPEHERPPVSSRYVEPRNDAERKLSAIWQKRLGIARIGIHDNFFELGGDSVQGLHIVTASRAAGMVFTVKELLKHQTVASLAAAASTSGALDAEQGPVIGPLAALTPIQRWFFERDPVEPHHFNLAFVLESRQPVDAVELGEALDAVVWHHDALRLRYRHTGGDWRAEIAPPGESVLLEVIDLGDVAEAQHAARIEEEAIRSQASLDLDTGPILRAVLFHAGSSVPDRLLLVVHHVAVDVVSWRVVLEDLTRALRQRSHGRILPLPRKTTSVRAWTDHLVKRAQSGDVTAATDAWLALPWSEIRHVPVDHEGGGNTIADAVRLTSELSPEHTKALLTHARTALDARVDEVLLTSLARTIAMWAGGSHVVVDLEAHGRDSVDDAIDVSRTVGWFTAIHPVLLEVDEALEAGQLLSRVKERVGWFREHEINYGLARYLSADEERVSALSALPRAEINFVYHGRLDAVVGSDDGFVLTRIPTGPARSLRAERYHLLEVDASVFDGVLRVNWTYSAAVHAEATVRALSESFRATLLELIAAADPGESPHPESSERFGWSADDMGDILAEVRKMQE